MIIKNIFLITLILFMVACGGGGSKSAKAPNTQLDMNQSDADADTNPNDTNSTEEPTTQEENSTQDTNDSNQVNQEENNQSTGTENEEVHNTQSTNEPNPETQEQDPSTPLPNQNGKAQLGVLSNAEIKLYELNKLEKKLLATTFSSEGDSIESIGNFNLYLEKIQDDKLYLYEVTKGKDFDVDDNGIIDEIPSQNQGTFHLLILGEHIKAIKQANVTVVSEVVYQKLLPFLSLEQSTIMQKMQNFVQEIIQIDVNEDGFVGIEDMLRYNPVNDKEKLFPEYQHKISQVINDILNNRSSDFNAPIFSEENPLISINENLTFIKKVTITDASSLNIMLLGKDAKHFGYQKDTQELSFVLERDFETAEDFNQDNFYEVSIEATDSYFNRSEKTFFIQVLDVNETVPSVPQLQASSMFVDENLKTGSLVGTVAIERLGSSAITGFTLSEEESQFFTVSLEGEIFTKQSFDYELKSDYSFLVEAQNIVGKSNKIRITVQVNDVADIKPSLNDVYITVPENRAIGSFIGKLSVLNHGDSNISSFTISGVRGESFEATLDTDLNVLVYLDYESYRHYYLQYTATNQAGESEKSNLTIQVTNLFENSGSDYPKTESGIQNALDNTDYAFVLNQLLNNRDLYANLDDNNINMNIAAAYVGSSGYTVFDITGAMGEGNTSTFNDFVHNITKNNDPAVTINHLAQADNYYSQIIQGLDCTNTLTLTQLQQDSCYNLGLVRLTSLTNSVKLLFGGDDNTVSQWAIGVEENSSNDLNGNTVLDNSEAAACAVVYANNPNDNCQNGTFYAYKGGVTFNKNGNEHKLSLIEIDVGNPTNGYHSFYQLISSNTNNNTPILTSGVCDVNFKQTTNLANGTSLFPCPVFNSNGDIMGIKQSLEQVANIQALFPNGDDTKTTIENYLQNITGDSNGTIGLDNLSTYLRTN